MLGYPEPRLSGPMWVDELYETLTAMTPSERTAVRAVDADGHEGGAEDALQRGRSPWLPALLDGGDLFMAYQPMVDLASGATVAYEALVRGALDDDEVVAGHQIVTAARAHDRVRQLDESGRTLALEQAADGLGRGTRLFVNVDPMSVYDPEVCLRTTWEAARRMGIHIDRICFELVDIERCPDLDFLRRIIERFRSEGAQVALQNLGAECMGIDYLLELRPDVVKLERRMTAGLEREGARRRLVETMIAYAQELGSAVGVVGIETEADLRCARALGADLGQGFYLGPPARRPLAVDPSVVTTSAPAVPTTGSDDPLTGLPRRLAFQGHVEMLLEAGRSVAVLMLELQAFTRITDMLGHDVGDRVLMTVAESLRDEVGEAGYVARLGDDQFLVALDDVRSGEEAARYGRHLAETVDAAALDTELPAPHPAVGVATAPSDGQDPAVLLRHAGSALHRAHERTLTQP